MSEYSFSISGVYYGKNRTFPGLNEYLSECGRNPMAGGKLKKDFELIAVNAIRRDLKGATADNPISIKYVFYEADTRRDKGNIFAFADKIIEDALQDVGFIPNDNWVWISKIESPDFYVDKTCPRIEVTIREVIKWLDANEKSFQPLK